MKQLGTPCEPVTFSEEITKQLDELYESDDLPDMGLKSVWKRRLGIPMKKLNDWLKQKAFEKCHVSAQTGSCESSKSNSPSESTKSMGSAVLSSSTEPRTPEESHCAPEKSPESTENASPLSSSAEPETPEETSTSMVQIPENFKNKRLSQDLVDKLQELFQINEMPGREISEQWAQQLGISLKTLNNWMQKKRSQKLHPEQAKLKSQRWQETRRLRRAGLNQEKVEKALPYLEAAFKRCQFATQQTMAELKLNTSLQKSQIRLWFSRRRKAPDATHVPAIESDSDDLVELRALFNATEEDDDSDIEILRDTRQEQEEYRNRPEVRAMIERMFGVGGGGGSLDSGIPLQ